MRHTITATTGLAFALVLLGASACDPAQDTADDEPVTGEQSSLELLCNANDVAWPLGATSAQKRCAGPWEFRKNASPCYKQLVNRAECPFEFAPGGGYAYQDYPDRCNDYAACNVAVWDGWKQVTPVKLWVRWPAFGNHPPLPPPAGDVVVDLTNTDLTEGDIRAVVESTCLDKVSAWRETFINGLPPDVREQARQPGKMTILGSAIFQCQRDGSGCLDTNVPAGDPTDAWRMLWLWRSSTIHFECRTYLQGYPHDWRQEPVHLNWRHSDGTAVPASESSCPLAREPYTCPDLSKPRHLPCRHPAFGLAVDPSECGPAGDVAYSLPGMTLAELELDPTAYTRPDAPPVCLSGEDVPLDTPEHAREHQARLLERLRKLTTSGYPASVDATALLRRLVLNAKLSFELVGADLSGAPGDVVADAALGDQIDATLRLYTQYTTTPYTPTCGLNPTPPDTSVCELGRLSLSQLNNQLAVCERLRSSHVGPGVRGRQQVFEKCLGLADRMVPLRTPLFAHGGSDDGSATDPGQDVCHFKAYRERFDAVSSRPLRELLAAFADPRTSEGAAKTARRLWMIDAWAVAARKLYPDIASDGVRQALTSQLVAAFWRGMYREIYAMGDPYAPPASELEPPRAVDAGLPLPSTVDPPGVQIITTAAHNQLDADRAILRIAFTPWRPGIEAERGVAARTPLLHAPLLLIVADAMHAMHQRMGDLALYHDVGCAYLGCTGGNFPSETARLWRLMAFFPEQTRLAAELSIDRVLRDENGAQVVRDTWLNVFDRISSGHSALDAALADAFDVPLLQLGTIGLLGPNLQPLPVPALPLADMVRDAQAKADAYAGSGLLLGPSNRLRAGAHEEFLTQRRGLLEQLTTTLTTRLTTYGSAMSDLAKNLIQEFEYAALIVRGRFHVQGVLDEISELEDNLAGIRSALDASERAFAEHMSGYAALARIDANASIGRRAISERFIGASGARATGHASVLTNVTTIALPGHETLAAGEVLRLETTGTYAPSCALTGAPPMLLPGSEEPARIGAAHPFTGPEGYMIRRSGSDFATQSHEEAKAHSDHTSVAGTFEACAGAKVGYGAGIGQAAGIIYEVYARIEACAKIDGGYSDSTQRTDSSGNGSEGRTSAEFAIGLRLPTAPYDLLPAGALLMVVTPRDQPAITRDIRVVQAPSTAYVASEPVDIYFVVNDVAGCSDDDSHQLHLTGAVIQHRGQFTLGLEPVIARAIQSIAAERPNIVQQGRLLPQTAALLRSRAYRFIVEAGIDPSSLPSAVQAFLESWLDASLARIELEVEHRRVSLALNAKRLELRALVEDASTNRAQSRIAALLPAWSLRDLDGEAIRDEARLVADMLLHDFFPVIALRYRGLFNTLSSQGAFRGALLKLIRTRWDDSVQDVGQGLRDASQAISVGLASVEGTTPELVRTIVLEIPKPGKTPTWYSVDSGRAQKFWASLVAVNTGHRGTINIVPDDLYRPGAGLGVPCNYEAPVIRDMAIYLTGVDTATADNENRRLWHGTLQTSSTMLFPTGARAVPPSGSNGISGDPFVYAQGGPLVFDVSDPAWTAPAVPVRFEANAIDVATRYESTRPDGPVNNSARGLSPFTSFTFDLSELWDPALRPPPGPDFDSTNPVAAATSAHVVLRVEMRSVRSDSSLRWIERCRPR